jgi:hypothetical protein
MRGGDNRLALSDAASGAERGHGFRAIGVMATKLVRPVAAKGGGVLLRLKADWPAIVGAEWARAAWPAALARDGALKLRITPVAALDLQHRAPLLIERVNLFFGRAVVSRLVLVQGMPSNRATPLDTAAHLPVEEDCDAGDGQFGGIAEPALRFALARLGRAIRETNA